jgi:hypothetical protein
MLVAAGIRPVQLEALPTREPRMTKLTLTVDKAVIAMVMVGLFAGCGTAGPSAPRSAQEVALSYPPITDPKLCAELDKGFLERLDTECFQLWEDLRRDGKAVSGRIEASCVTFGTGRGEVKFGQFSINGVPFRFDLRRRKYVDLLQDIKDDDICRVEVGGRYQVAFVGEDLPRVIDLLRKNTYWVEYEFAYRRYVSPNRGKEVFQPIAEQQYWGTGYYHFVAIWTKQNRERWTTAWEWLGFSSLAYAHTDGLISLTNEVGKKQGLRVYDVKGWPYCVLPVGLVKPNLRPVD